MTAQLVPLLLGIKWLDLNYLQTQYGSSLIWIALVIVFIECGLFFPFLPGDTLLFALGLLIAGSGNTVLDLSNDLLELVLSIVLLSAAAVAGNVVGYEIGRKIGPPLYQHDGRILKRKYLDNTSAFFDRHGNKALVIGRFVPFVRTYITVVAGVTEMPRRRFLQWSLVGAVLWVVAITLLGYFLGAAFPAIGDNIDYVTAAILLFTVIPLGIEWLKHRHDAHEETEPNAEPEGSSAS